MTDRIPNTVTFFFLQAVEHKGLAEWNMNAQRGDNVIRMIWPIALSHAGGRSQPYVLIVCSFEASV